MKDFLLSRPPVPLVQSPAFATAVRHLGGQAELRALPDGGSVVTVSRRLPLRRALRMVSRGPVFGAHTAPEDRLACLRGLRLHVVNAPDPDAGPMLRAAGFGQVMTAATVAQLTTQPDLDRQLANARPKWRSDARQGLRAGLDLWCRPFETGRDGWLLTRDLAAQRRKGYRALPPALLRALHHVAPGDLTMAGADLDGRTVAAMLFIRHGTCATYQIGWSGALGRRDRAHHAMLAHVAPRFHASGVTQIELGMLDTAATPGLARFKLGSGARPQTLGGTWIRMPGWRG
ncbi:GNAT family N-acetyltransferase [Salipiger sp. IMCC34102]|uniref:GNAT family N-acetyltransferase n=1 Tax=Salipiger sp. IMCC34102 TaxID=2510647 RepID=UPI00101C19FF|nr:GNAT family N-acetyltransferase [Salipiger sp. IMCC34102]RYH03468.1 GNAT family N-acetyltransferase [Salipiger sp. IMCC34102]